jgi:hypothetical protein
MKKKVIYALTLLLIIAGVFIAIQKIPEYYKNRQVQKEKQSKVEQLRDRLLSCSEGQEQYDQGIYYKIVDNTKDAELLFQNLTERLKTGKQYKGTDIIWTATDSDQDTLRMTIHLQPTNEEWLGIIEVKYKGIPDIKQINLYEAATTNNNFNFQRGVLNDVE